MAEICCRRLRDDRSTRVWLSLCGEMNSDIRHLKQQKQILLNISGEITYLHRPMEEIFDIIADKAEMPYDLFLRSVSQGMKERDGKSLVSIWNAAVRDRKNGADLSQIAIAYLEKMGNCFEYEGERLQVEALRLFEREIDGEIDRLTVKKNENSRLIKALSTLTGILCIILFL